MPLPAIFTPIHPQLGSTFQHALVSGTLSLGLVVVHDLARAGATFRSEVVHSFTLATQPYGKPYNKATPSLPLTTPHFSSHLLFSASSCLPMTSISSIGIIPHSCHEPTHKRASTSMTSYIHSPSIPMHPHISPTTMSILAFPTQAQSKQNKATICQFRELLYTKAKTCPTARPEHSYTKFIASMQKQRLKPYSVLLGGTIVANLAL